MEKLFNKDFLLLWQGQLVSQIGSQAFAVAMVLWVKHETGSAFLMGLILTLSSIPGIVLSPFAGVFADRHSRKAIIVFCDLINGIAVLTLYGIMVIAPSNTDLILVWLSIVATLVAAVSSFFRPAITAAIPDIVPSPRVVAANSLNQSSIQIAMFFGQGAGGILYRLLGAPVLFLMDGLSYLFSALSETFIKIPQAIPEKESSWKGIARSYGRDFQEGLKFVLSNKGMTALLFSMAFANFFGVPFIVLLPFYVEDVLRLRSDWYGYFLAAYGFGSLLGYVFAGSVRLSLVGKRNALIGSLILMSVGLGALGVITVPIIALSLFLIVGYFNGYFNVNVITILQQATPSHLRGRVFGVVLSVVMALAPIGMSFAGFLADALNHDVASIYIACGVVLVTLSVLVSARPDFRLFLQTAEKEQ
jgi:MFS family permease